MESFRSLMFLVFIFILCASLISSVFGQLRKASSSKFGSNEYWLFKDRKTWPEAVLQCEKEGMEIAEVRTSSEAGRIAQLMMKNRPDAVESAWIGGYAKNKTGGIVWRWISTNEQIDNNVLWKNSQNLKKNPPVKGCLLFDWHHREEPGFIESSCDMKREYICQKMINSSVEGGNSADRRDKLRIFMPIQTTSTSTEKMASIMTSVSIEPTTTVLVQTTSEMTTSAVNLLEKNGLLRTTMKSGGSDREYDEYYDYEVTESVGLENTTEKTVETTVVEQKTVETTTEAVQTSPVEQTTVETTTKTVQTTTAEQKRRIFTSPRPPLPIKKDVKTPVDQWTKFDSNPHPKNDVKFMDNLKLYYAFEGPMVGGLYSTNSRANSLSMRKYKKYIPIKKKPSNNYPKRHKKLY